MGHHCSTYVCRRFWEPGSLPTYNHPPSFWRRRRPPQRLGGRREPQKQCSASVACRGWCQQTLVPASPGTPGTVSQPRRATAPLPWQQSTYFTHKESFTETLGNHDLTKGTCWQRWESSHCGFNSKIIPFRKPMWGRVINRGSYHCHSKTMSFYISQ